MPSGLMPAYSYRPPARPLAEAQLRTCSSRRGRLFAGGTYFRSRDVGLQQNRISVEIVEYEAPTGTAGVINSGYDGVCIITNHNLSFDENVAGPAKAVLLQHRLKANEYVKIYELDHAQARAAKYSISFKIAPAPEDTPDPAELGAFSFSRLFNAPSLLSAKLTPEQSVFTPTDEILIKPRYRVYRLTPKSVESTDTPGDWSYGWDIEDLRTKVNADNPWVEMLPRSGPIDDGMGGTTPNLNPEDVQDTGSDAAFLTPFSETFLAGGDGLPASPNNESTGPTRSLVHVNYGEAQNGELREVNIVYEWVGDDVVNGSWKAY